MSKKKNLPKPASKKSFNRPKTPIFFFNIKQYWVTFFMYFRKEYYPTLISHEAKMRYKIFKELKSISRIKKKQLGNNYIRSSFVKLAYANFIQNRLHEVREMLYRFTVIIFFLFLGLVANKYFGYKNLNGMSFQSYLLQFGPTILILFIIRSVLEAISRRITFGQKLLLISTILIISVLYITLVSSAYRVLFLGILGFHAITIISIAVDTLIIVWAEQFVNRSYPQAIVTHNIIMVLSGIEKRPLSELEFKKWCVRKLEYAATAIEVYIQRRLRTSDVFLNDWLKNKTKQIANALRDKKKWIYFPKQDIRQKLTANLTKFLFHFLRNEWDNLEKLDVKVNLLKYDWKAQIVLVVRTIIVGFLPIVILYASQYFKLVTQPFNEYIISLAIFWGLLNLLWAIDPALREKIGALKDTTGFLGEKVNNANSTASTK